MGRNDGGPAFPVITRPDDIDGGYGHQAGPNTYQFGGMTLRDAAAFAALPAIGIGSNTGAFPVIAEMAYKMADAMLAEREKGGGE